jgi:2-polyprenyl-3-methyl-5-hydroxy-6-metoxy-1,4-benzoquinol methylase
MRELLTYGNTAKLYCVDRIDELAAARETLRIVDLGCGRGANFAELLRRRPHVAYVGVDADAEACAAARATLAGLRAEIVHGDAAAVRVGPADVVVSFSVLEHVPGRAAYLESVAANLAPEGRAFVNYDAGHFVSPSPRELAKTAAGQLLARLGRPQLYQAFVREAEFRRLVAAADLEIVEAKSFNTGLKEAYTSVPQASRTHFMEIWLDAELQLNELGIKYDDRLARVFRTRNFVLAAARASLAMPASGSPASPAIRLN